MPQLVSKICREGGGQKDQTAYPNENTNLLNCGMAVIEAKRSAKYKNWEVEKIHGECEISNSSADKDEE